MNRHVAQMMGRRFGKLVVISHHSREQGYLCQCDCGGQTIAKTHALKTGKHTSCRCGLKAPRFSARQPESQAVKNYLYRNYRKAAARRGYEFGLDMETFCLLIGSNCHYCGAAPHMTIRSIKAHQEFKYNGVDRVDNCEGYSLSNCVSCCDICNTSKAELTLEQWTTWLERVHHHQQLQKERSTTIPSGSTPKRAEMGATPRG